MPETDDDDRGGPIGATSDIMTEGVSHFTRPGRVMVAALLLATVGVALCTLVLPGGFLQLADVVLEPLLPPLESADLDVSAAVVAVTHPGIQAIFVVGIGTVRPSPNRHARRVAKVTLAANRRYCGRSDPSQHRQIPI